MNERNRANAADRPQKTRDCRGENPTPKGHVCAEGGHDFKFQRMDTYGICKRCGDEVLT